MRQNIQGKRLAAIARIGFSFLFAAAILAGTAITPGNPSSYAFAQNPGNAQNPVNTQSPAENSANEFDSGPQLYFFTNEACGPCKSVEPILLGMAEQGYPITRIDTHVHRAWVEQFRVASTPTVVFVDRDREILRHSGQVDAATVAGWFAQSGFQPGALTEEEFVAQYNQHRAADTLNAADKTTHNGTRQPGNRVETIALDATVRLRVEDPEGISFATGTVIHCHNGEWLVLTCGHVFRDSNGKGDTKVEHDFGNGPPRTSSAELIYYEAGNRDIALVAVNAGVNIIPVEIADAGVKIGRGNGIFSIGCDHGETPTIRRSKIKNNALYNGVSKYDIYGRPVDGRSGGGLFTNDGRLIGVCNAAAVEFDEGIYTAIDTVYWQLETAGLDHLFDRQQRTGQPVPAQGPAMAIASIPETARPVPPGADQGFPAEQRSARDLNTNPASAALPDDRVPAHERGLAGRMTDSGSGPLVGGFSPTPVSHDTVDDHAAGLLGSEYEVIVIVRSRVDPTNTQAITLTDPSDKLLRYLERVGNEQFDDRPIDMARLRLPMQRVRFR